MHPETASKRPRQVELKYLVPAARAAFVRAWLDGIAQPDRQYPPALVVTTYYDTPGLDLLEEKINSDYLKAKVRVRWYAPLDGGPVRGPVFVECKFREGATRDKRRVLTDADPARLVRLPWSAPEWAELLDEVRADVPWRPGTLAPVLRLTYARYRYTDGAAGRLALDTDLTVDAVNPARVASPARRDPLPLAVFECKAAGQDLPARLAPLVRFGARRSSFSKYLACYQHVTRGLLY